MDLLYLSSRCDYPRPWIRLAFPTRMPREQTSLDNLTYTKHYRGVKTNLYHAMLQFEFEAGFTGPCRIRDIDPGSLGGRIRTESNGR
jgi:hypothetical protein